MLAAIPVLAGRPRVSELQQALQAVQMLLAGEQTNEAQTSAAGRCVTDSRPSVTAACVCGVMKAPCGSLVTSLGYRLSCSSLQSAL